MKNTLIIICLLVIVASSALDTAPIRYTSAGNVVILDMVIITNSAVEMCKGTYNRQTQHFTPNPIAPLFPALIVDC